MLKRLARCFFHGKPVLRVPEGSTSIRDCGFHDTVADGNNGKTSAPGVYGDGSLSAENPTMRRMRSFHGGLSHIEVAQNAANRAAEAFFPMGDDGASKGEKRRKYMDVYFDGFYNALFMFCMCTREDSASISRPSDWFYEEVKNESDGRTTDRGPRKNT